MDGVPTVAQAADLAGALLADLGDRWHHVQAIGREAERLGATVAAQDRPLLAAAGWLHDVGYAPAVADTGFHPLDGARFLEREGYHPRLCALVAQHSGARLEAQERGLAQALARFPLEDSPVMDALVTADTTTGPQGQSLEFDDRLDEVLARYPAGSPVHRAVRRGRAVLRVHVARVEARLCSPLPAPGDLAAPGCGQVDVWWQHLPADGVPAHVRRELAADLDDATRARLDRYRRAVDRDRGLLAHVLLRRLAAAHLGCAPARVRIAARCSTCGAADHGKPVIAHRGSAPLQVNLSHSGRVVAVALSAPGRAVGIDVEREHRGGWDDVAATAFDDRQWRAIQAARLPDGAACALWTRKEATLKAIGVGLAHPLRAVQVTAATGGQWQATTGDTTVAGCDLRTAPGHAGAVAVTAPADPSGAAAVSAPSHQLSATVRQTQLW